MMFPAICGRESQSINEAADLMQKWHLSRLPCSIDRSTLVGIVSLRDLQGPTHRDNHQPN